MAHLCYEDSDLGTASAVLLAAGTEAVLSDCESAWTNAANVTDESETTIKKVGSNSRKLTIAAGFTTGIIATIAVSSTNVTARTHIECWLYSDTAVAAGVLSLMIDEHGACASPSVSYTIPALTAATWHRLVWPIGGAAADLDAIISVGLKANSDPGAIILYIDDVRVTTSNATLTNCSAEATNGTFSQVIPHAGEALTSAKITPSFVARWMKIVSDVVVDVAINTGSSYDGGVLRITANESYTLPWPVRIENIELTTTGATTNGIRIFFAGRV